VSVLDFDRFEEVLGSLRRNLLRTTLTAIGVFWGVLLLIVMVGMGNGLETGAKKSMSGLATNSMYIWGQRTSVPFQGMSPGRRVRLTLEDAEALGKMEGVRLVAPRVSLGGRRSTQAVTRGTKTGNFTVMGDTPEYLIVQPMEIRGRFVNKLDMDRCRKICVVGTQVVKELFGKDAEDPIGDTIQVRGIEFTIVGVFETNQTGDRGERHASTIYTPLTTFQKALNPWPFIHYMAVLSVPEVRAGAIENDVKMLLHDRHKVSAKDKQAIGSFNADAEYQKLMSLFRGIAWLILVVAGATLMAGLVGVSNIMMVSVRERTREIGIRKAIGATPRAVIGQIVTEAIVLASVAGYLGLVAGVGLLELVGAAMAGGGGKSMFAAPEVSLATAVVAALAVAFGGGIAGLFPALHAARINTVAALRSE
jgi:putative ABC transport system permease protein